jgi:hypothetical protein
VPAAAAITNDARAAASPVTIINDKIAARLAVDRAPTGPHLGIVWQRRAVSAGSTVSPSLRATTADISSFRWRATWGSPISISLSRI